MVAQVFPEHLAQQFVVTIGQDTGVRLADRARQLSLRSRVTLLFLMTGTLALRRELHHSSHVLVATARRNSRASSVQ